MLTNEEQTVEDAFMWAIRDLRRAAESIATLRSVVGAFPGAVPLSRTELRRLKIAAGGCDVDATMFEQMRGRGRARRRRNPGVKGATS